MQLLARGEERIMKISRFARLLTFLAISFGVTCSYGQRTPLDHPKVILGAIANIRSAAPYTLRLYSSSADEADPVPSATFSNQQGLSTGVFSPALVGQLVPCRVYRLAITSTSWSWADVAFNVPAGYVIKLGAQYDRRVARSTMRTPDNNGASATYVMDIELQPQDGANYLKAGAATLPTLGEVKWSVGLGATQAGLAVGALRWRQPDINPTLLDPISLEYSDPMQTGVSVARSNGRIIWIQTWAIYVQVQSLSNGYLIVATEPWSNKTLYQYRVSNPDATWQGRVKIEATTFDDGGNRVDTWVLSQTTTGQSFEQSNGARKITTDSTTSGGLRTETITIEDASAPGVPVAKTRRVYQTFSWGREELIQNIADPDGLALTTEYKYFDPTSYPLGSGSYAKLQSVKRSDGSWECYEYYDDAGRWGRLKAIYKPWQDDAPVSPDSATSTNCQYTEFDYTGERDIYQELISRREMKILGTTAGKVTTTYAFNTASPWASNPAGSGGVGPQPVRVETETVWSSATASLTTIRKYFHTTADQAYAGRMFLQQNPDGTKVVIRHNVSTSFRTEERMEGYGQGTYDYFTGNQYDQQAYGFFAFTSNKNTSLKTTYDDHGRIFWEDGYLAPGSPVTHRYYQYSTMTGELLNKWCGEVGQITEWHFSRTDAKTWSETAQDGTITDYFLDQYGRLQRKQLRGISAAWIYPNSYSSQSAVTTAYTYDAADHVIGTTTSADSLSLSTFTSYNLAGLPVSQTDERGLQTATTYADGGATVTTTFPGGAQKIERHYRDGSPKATEGTAVIRSFKKVTCNGDGTITTETQIGATADRWQRVTTDWAGRTIKEERPAPPGAQPAIFTKAYLYDGVGQLAKTSEPGMADSLYYRDPAQKVTLQALDLNQNGAIDLASTDRVVRNETQVLSSASNISEVTTTTGYAVLNSGSSFAVAITSNPLGPQAVTNWPDPTRSFCSQTTDVNGNVTTTTATYDQANAILKTVVSTPVGSEWSFSRNGLLEWHFSKNDVRTRYLYDALRRQTEIVDPRTGSSKIGYYTSYTGCNGQVAWKEDASGARTSYYYSSVDGRLSQTIDAQGNSTYYAYNSRGDLIRQWGAATYPVEYEYNDYGEKVKMRTFRDPSTDFTQASFPYTYPSTAGDVTTWAYDAAAGSLLNKTDAAGRSTDYAYNVRGQLVTRQWARHVDPANNASARLTTTYSYDPLTAEQTAITYNDGTPALVYTYNRLGQLSKVEQWLDTNGTQKRTTLFDRALSGDVAKETLDIGFFGGRILTNLFDAPAIIGRRNGYKLGTASAASSEADVSYRYSSPRLDSIIERNQTFGALYSYVSDSENLISTVKTGTADLDAWSYVPPDGDDRLQRTSSYEDHRDHLTALRTEYGQFEAHPDDDPPADGDPDPIYSHRLIAGLTYQVDSIGRRTSAIHEGEVMADYGEPSLHLFTYNARSELTADASFMGSTVTDQTRPLSGRRFEFAYDNIGNRQWSNQTGVTGLRDDYTTNALNQYVTRENNTVPMSGTDTAGTTVAVSYGSSSAARQGKFWADQSVVPNSTSAWYGTLSVTSTPSGGSPAVIQTKQVGVPAASESMTYDLDGNILQDGRWVYTWDAENRLIQIETRDIAYNAGIPRQRLKFTYDYLGRRIQKTVENWSGSAYTLSVSRKFIYDGWNMIAEYDALSGFNLLRTYLWGLDLSRSLSDAGGVGGLLLIHDWPTGKEYQPAYDGNGNVLGLLRRSDASVAASYEYSPSGEFLRLTINDSTIADQPFRFSTKYYDGETGLYDYGHRYYSPSQGRFLGRDPIEEKGGLHLYAFCQNNAINGYDILGNLGAYLDSDGKSWLWDGYDDDGGSVSGVDLDYAIGRGWASSTGKPLFTDMGYGVHGDEDTGAGGESMTLIVDGQVTGTISSTDASTYSIAQHALDNPTWGIENGILKPTGGESSGPTLVPPAAGGVQVGPIMIQTSNGNFVPLGSQAADDFAVAPNSVSMAQTPFPTNNTGDTVIVVTPGGNALPVPAGGTLTGSPDGKYIQVRNPDGSESGTRIDGGHNPASHPDPRAQGPHAHVPGVTTADGKPWLPVRPEPAPLLTGRQAAGGVAAVGTGYLIYRGARMLPSLLPPLWWTIPENVVVP
jgi:RHS repeat-associated protein